VIDWLRSRRPRLRVHAGPVVAGLVLTIALTAGCRGFQAPSGSAAGQQVTVKALDTMRFDPPTLNVSVGQPVKVTLENDGSLIHDFVLNEGPAQPFKIEANGSTSITTTVTLVRAGTYTYICAQPGHEAAGMKGTIVAR